jgi:hypothetical protein
VKRTVKQESQGNVEQEYHQQTAGHARDRKVLHRIGTHPEQASKVKALAADQKNRTAPDRHLRQPGQAHAQQLAQQHLERVICDGSFAAWKAFLASGVALPEAIRHASLNIDYGTRFTFSSPTISLTWTPAFQKIDAEGELALSFAFMPDGKAARWQTGGVMAQPGLGMHDMVRINYHPGPSSDLDQSDQSNGKSLLKRGYPQNDKP